MLRLFALLVFMFSTRLIAQETPASPTLMTMGPIDGESDQKASIITVRYDSKPGFPKPKVEAMGSFIQVTLPSTMVPKPGQFIEANSPYIRKFAAFQLDEQTAGLRMFVTKEASHLVGAVTTDILENRVVIMLDHVEAEKQLLAHFDGVPVTGGPTAEEVVKKTEVRSDIPDPAKTQVAPKEAAAKAQVAPATAPETPAWSDGLQDKLVLVTGFLAVMLMLLIGMKSWRRMMTKKWPGAPVEDYSLKTLATHAVGPKQKLTVVQVGQEQILLGVSPDNINFLTSLKKPSETQAQPRVAIDPAMFQKQALPKEAQVRRSGPVLDDVSPRPAPRQRATPRSELPEPGSAISYGISDQGIKNMKSQNRASSEPRASDEPSSVDDVTRMIRKRLRDLPKV
ncbi:MAG TPA: flagellar biosynthetic protein FliO [Oligoflexus sp.]|uniref:FliO/MopB family protein n=1 Tax=Oligoflexus sp. TaxID=1971216 RepID=UPI002D29FC71|nr:flagellar biosynthetic protein FliO [Oligoflexus sp.]HYX39257.1 flagellar biosynthetic protein FliO [Oligoflexus sp.]